MKTMQEVQTLISDLQQFYTDVRLLDAAAIERIEEGVRSNPNAEELCYACRHRNRRCHHCAVKSAFENHDQRSKLEYFSPDIVQVSAQYMEVDGAPYVMELLQRMQSDTIVEPDDTEALFSALSGYNTKLYHDPLTDMYNRRYYEEIVRGMKGPIGVALMDLDDFKVYNDTYGHHAGDMALKTAATIVRGCIRQTDALVRFGGDEFLLILPGIPEDYFKIKLEQIREKLHDAHRARLQPHAAFDQHRRADPDAKRQHGRRGPAGRPADVSGQGSEELRRRLRRGASGGCAGPPGGKAADPHRGRFRDEPRHPVGDPVRGLQHP